MRRGIIIIIRFSRSMLEKRAAMEPARRTQKSRRKGQGMRGPHSDLS
jgi:hypothetical protein